MVIISVIVMKHIAIVQDLDCEFLVFLVIVTCVTLMHSILDKFYSRRLTIEQNGLGWNWSGCNDIEWDGME